MNKFLKDMFDVTDKNEISTDLQRLINRVHKYAGKTRIDDQKEFVDFILLMSAIMDVPEETWNEVVKRLYLILVHKETGLTPGDIQNMIRMANTDSEGPIH